MGKSLYKVMICDRCGERKDFIQCDEKGINHLSEEGWESRNFAEKRPDAFRKDLSHRSYFSVLLCPSCNREFDSLRDKHLAKELEWLRQKEEG